MKLALTSDLHLEFGDFDIQNQQNADILILAGDICVAKDFRLLDSKYQAKCYHKFFKKASSEFDKIIFIMGNHEHYHGDFALTERILREEMAAYSNIHFLSNESIDLHGHRFFGGTLWTNINNSNPNTIIHVKNMLNDFRVIKNSNIISHYRVPVENEEVESIGLYNTMRGPKLVYKQKVSIFSPQDSIDDHLDFIEKLQTSIKETDMPVIVVSHHLPTFNSIPERFRNEFQTNYAFASDLSELILDNQSIKYWIHGHSHDNSDYMIGDTRVICNPRGYYGRENRAMTHEVMYFDL